MSNYYGKTLNPGRKNRIRTGFGADRQVIRYTNNPSTINPGEILASSGTEFKATIYVFLFMDGVMAVKDSVYAGATW